MDDQQNFLSSLKNQFIFSYRQYTTDTRVIEEVLSNNCYGLSPKMFIDCGPLVIIDIGAHIGAFSIAATQFMNDVTIFSYEPDEDSFQLLKKNILSNGVVEKVKPHKLAVTGDVHTAAYFEKGTPANMHPAGKRMSLRKDSVHTIEAKVLTLSDIFFRNAIDFCHILKIDCEGEEVPILLSTPREVLRKVEMLVGEFHDFDVNFKMALLKKHLLNSFRFVEFWPLGNDKFTGKPLWLMVCYNSFRRLSLQKGSKSRMAGYSLMR